MPPDSDSFVVRFGKAALHGVPLILAAVWFGQQKTFAAAIALFTQIRPLFLWCFAKVKRR